MGNLFSSRIKKESYLSVLEITQSSTLDEIKESYEKKRALSINDKNSLEILDKAYDKACGTLIFEVYTNELFEKEFCKYADDFFKRLEIVYGTKAPVLFRDCDFARFYRFWTVFIHEDKAIQRSIRHIINEIKKRDPRFTNRKRENMFNNKFNNKSCELKAVKNSEVRTTCKINDNKKIYGCESCNKQFSSDNTYSDHLRSRKHKEKAIYYMASNKQV